MSGNKVAVIGIGSPFGEDQLGWQVVRYLRKRSEHKGKSHVKFLVEDRPGLALLEKMKGYHQVVLVDAVLSEKGEEGAVHHIDQQQLISLSQNSLSSHAAGVAEAVALGAILNELPEQLDLVGVDVSGSGATVSVDHIEKAGLRVEEMITPDYSMH